MSLRSSSTIMLLADLPSALTFALIDLAPCISACKYALQIVTWSSSSWYNSWIALALWWAICLLLQRLFLPFLFVAVFAFAQWRNNHRPLESLSTENTVQNIITDITIIQSLLPRFPHTLSIPLPKLLRVAAICYLPYLFLTSFLSLRVIFAIAGTLLLSWRAPWAIVIRTTVWHSAWFRWSIYKLWSHLTGDPLPPPTMSAQSTSDSFAPVQSLRFLFTIYENQRWWMGLDWTAALLPAERPSWCSASQQPIPPPNAFTLPENTIIYLPDATGNRMKRTAIWKWEEPEWRVLVRRDGSGTGLTRVERPLSTVKDDATNNSRFLKAATGRGGGPATSGNVDEDYVTADSKESPNEDPLTDSDGWVYGDNKWENQSNRGGMGKYTRYRRWTRVAAVYETVELDVGPSLPQSATEQETSTITPTSTLVDQSSNSQHSIPDMASMDDPPESPLRQRLRMALNKGSTPSI
ncbi:hypothetical protein BYT27DRAFT_7230629 [Phlegmacium glaucopus]|nr:hypothetical protein BYT27DRAFT_7230629 [Phlegmacium glaucopus]